MCGVSNGATNRKADGGPGGVPEISITVMSKSSNPVAQHGFGLLPGDHCCPFIQCVAGGKEGWMAKEQL
jgi:hypothetical protein